MRPFCRTLTTELFRSFFLRIISRRLLFLVEPVADHNIVRAGATTRRAIEVWDCGTRVRPSYTTLSTRRAARRAFRIMCFRSSSAHYLFSPLKLHDTSGDVIHQKRRHCAEKETFDVPPAALMPARQNACRHRFPYRPDLEVYLQHDEIVESICDPK